MVTVPNCLLVKVLLFESVASPSAIFEIVYPVLGGRAEMYTWSSQMPKQIPDAKIAKYPVVNTYHQIRTSKEFNLTDRKSVV